MLLRDAADSEALYTLAGGLKPMSSGFWSGSFEVAAPDLGEIDRVRSALAPLRDGHWYADVQVFAAAHEGKRMASAFVVHRPALSAMIDHFGAFWAPWGISPDTHPAEVVAVVDRMPRADRWRGYGYLFGFPADAVEFFVEAGLAAAEGGEAGSGVDREFIRLPTFGAEEGRFVYAVPLGHGRTAADRALAGEAERILRAYRDGRERWGDVDGLVSGLRRLDRRFRASSEAASALARSAESAPNR